MAQSGVAPHDAVQEANAALEQSKRTVASVEVLPPDEGNVAMERLAAVDSEIDTHRALRPAAVDYIDRAAELTIKLLGSEGAHHMGDVTYRVVGATVRRGARSKPVHALVAEHAVTKQIKSAGVGELRVVTRHVLAALDFEGAPVALGRLSGKTDWLERNDDGLLRRVRVTTSPANEQTRSRFFGDIEQMIEPVINGFQDKLRAYQLALETSPFRTQETANALAARLRLQEIHVRTEEEIRALSDLAGVDEVNITKLGSAANAADVLRHIISGHARLVRIEAAELARAYRPALAKLESDNTLDVPDLGKLTVKRFYGTKRIGFVRRLAVVALSIATAPLQFLLGYASITAPVLLGSMGRRAAIQYRNWMRITTARPLTVRVGTALSLDGRPVEPLQEARRKPERFLGAGATIRDDVALKFLQTWDQSLGAIETRAKQLNAGIQKMVNTGQKLGL